MPDACGDFIRDHYFLSYLEPMREKYRFENDRSCKLCKLQGKNKTLVVIYSADNGGPVWPEWGTSSGPTPSPATAPHAGGPDSPDGRPLVRRAPRGQPGRGRDAWGSSARILPCGCPWLSALMPGPRPVSPESPCASPLWFPCSPPFPPKVVS